MKIEIDLPLEKVLNLKASYYKETYDGIVPEFKAACIMVILWLVEIEVVKRDIVFSGDVVDTSHIVNK